METVGSSQIPATYYSKIMLTLIYAVITWTGKYISVIYKGICLL